MVSGVTVRCFSNVAERFLELSNNFQIIIFWVSLWRRRYSVTCQILFFTKQILLYEQILNYEILTKASSETIFPKKSNHYGEGYSVTCQVFFFTRNYFESSFRIKALGHPDIPRMKKYFAKNVEYIWRWQSNCMHPLYGEVVIGKGKLKTFSETRKNSHFQRISLNLDITPHGSWTCIERKKLPTVNFLIFVQKMLIEIDSKRSKSAHERVLRKRHFSNFSSWENDFQVVKSGLWGHISH